MSVSRRVRILHVDDDPAFLETISAALAAEREAFEVVTETSARAALDVLEETPVDCVLSDYEMPEMDGLTLLEAVREIDPGVPFILFTGKGTEAIASRAIPAGVTDYLQKEAEADQIPLLANRIENAIEQREHARQFESLVANLPGMVYQVRLEEGWPFEYVGGEVEALTGYPAERLASGDVSLGRDIIHPDDRERVMDAVRAHHESGDSFEVTYRMRTKSGDTRHVWERGRTVAAADGTPLVEGFITDVTERRERERELERFETFLDNSSDVIVHIGSDGQMRYQSPGTEFIFDHEPGRNLGKNVFDFVHPEDRERVLAEFLSAIDSPETQFETVEMRLEATDGEYVWVEAAGVDQTDTDIGGVIVSLRDISERKAHERELRRYGQTLEALQSTTRELLTAADREEVAELALASIEDILDFDTVGMWFADEERTVLEPVAISESGERLVSEPPVYSEASQSLSWEAYESGSLWVVEDTHEHDQRYNTETPIRGEIIAPLDEHGVLNVGARAPDAFDERDVTLVELWAGSVTAVLDRIEREHELRERETELTRERDRLDEFASVVSHDLRNPLNVATGRLELARAECESEHLESVDTALDRMEQLIGDSLALARQGEAVVETSSVALPDLVSDCADTVELDPAAIDVRTDIAVRADANRLAQVMENLLRNAVDHGGENVQVTVGDLSAGAGFYVADDGPGIPEDQRERIFESGYTRTDGGTGLGLAIVRQIVEAHGWDIRATEADTGGARFEISGVDIV